MPLNSWSFRFDARFTINITSFFFRTLEFLNTALHFSYSGPIILVPTQVKKSLISAMMSS
ncbi:hypothetical protein NADFUDRAFT_68844 [Nadsonia fulvescens var. elongata DSM 6958]|uniref:Uncharacterized protein n=1 Tax=Nadsonia fulvescens var. elongata DSM 6958 TaxID=857566 RepID=A0A1E3PTE0_9ASCO|nr:hypothetical protein NADFUDRAFT_68844 [Nadsonia fulvescens var. elongata DSM 6958]